MHWAGSATRYAATPRRKRRELVSIAGVIGRFPIFHQGVLPGGAKEIRTPDLLHAMQALYQLSYSPGTAPTPISM
jgi:hypothetical protein